VGIQEKGEGKFEDLVQKKCKYYYDLVDIMGDQSSSVPKVTSNINLFCDLESDDDDERQKSSGEHNDDDIDDNDDNFIDNNIDDDDDEEGNGMVEVVSTPMPPRRLVKKKITTTTTITTATKKKKWNKSRKRMIRCQHMWLNRNNAFKPK
jgi:hypothetical protein